MAASATVDKAPVGHHFDNLRQQQATVRFGMWIFLVTEVLFFGGALCAYTAYRIWYPREFEAGSAALNVGIASVNTFLLLASSLTITLAIRACYVGNQPLLKLWILATLVLGTAFLGLKLREYYLDYEEGLLPTLAETGAQAPGPHGTQRQITESKFVPAIRHALNGLESKYGVQYRYVESGAGRTFEDVEYAERKKAEGFVEVDLNKVQLFFLFYYILTGLHVAHMVIGIGLLLWQYTLAATGFFRYSERYVYVEVMSLYWHFVDMVWMFLVPLLYLAGPHSWNQAVVQFKEALGMVAEQVAQH